MAKLGDLFPDDLQTELPPKPASPPQPPRNFQGQPQPGGKVVPPRPRPPLPNSAPQRRGERVLVKDLIAGQEIEGIYLVGEVTLRAAKNGSKYIQATLCDKTGTVPARHWDATEIDFNSYKETSYVTVRARVETYKNALQVIVFNVQTCPSDGLNTADFLPISTRPLDEMEQEFFALIETFTDPHYKALLKEMFADKSIRERYMKGPAATAVHHAWIGGLVEHVLSACKTAQAIAEQRPFLNRDLLLAGVMLHDIGKIEELDSGPGFNYTDTGRLCGHIVLGALMVERFILKIKDFPQHKRDILIHMILSHHGELEYGSPVKPCTAEAVALHHLECLDAKVQGIQTIIERERAGGNDGPWSEFARVVDGRIYKGDR
jgi:3'-5' exoribonuclease